MLRGRCFGEVVALGHDSSTGHCSSIRPRALFQRAQPQFAAAAASVIPDVPLAAVVAPLPCLLSLEELQHTFAHAAMRYFWHPRYCRRACVALRLSQQGSKWRGMVTTNHQKLHRKDCRGEKELEKIKGDFIK